METIIDEIIQKLHTMPEYKVLQTLDFVKSISVSQPLSDLQLLSEDYPVLEDDIFETIADELAEELTKAIGENIPLLSDYAVSRAGIYEDKVVNNHY